MVTETDPLKLPPLGVIVGVATVGKLTVNVNDVDRVTPPPVADTVIVEDPAGVVPAVVLIVNVEEQVGVQLGNENDALAPAGKPEAENVTACALPDTNAALIVLLPGEPAVTDGLLVLVREKSNGWVTVNAALATPLGL